MLQTVLSWAKLCFRAEYRGLLIRVHAVYIELVVQALAVESVNTAAAAPEVLSPRPDGLGVQGLQADALLSIQSPLCVD